MLPSEIIPDLNLSSDINTTENSHINVDNEIEASTEQNEQEQQIEVVEQEKQEEDVDLKDNSELPLSSLENITHSSSINNDSNDTDINNKDEINLVPSLGFRVSSYKGGLFVASPEGCPHIPPPMIEIVKLFVEHIRQSELKVYDQYRHSGKL